MIQLMPPQARSRGSVSREYSSRPPHGISGLPWRAQLVGWLGNLGFLPCCPPVCIRRDLLRLLHDALLPELSHRIVVKPFGERSVSWFTLGDCAGRRFRLHRAPDPESGDAAERDAYNGRGLVNYLSPSPSPWRRASARRSFLSAISRVCRRRDTRNPGGDSPG